MKPANAEPEAEPPDEVDRAGISPFRDMKLLQPARQLILIVHPQEKLMKRLFSAPLLVLLATGCGSREGEFKPSGQPALKFEVRSASTDAVEGWQEVDGPPPEAKRLFLAPQAEVSNADVASTGVEKAKDGPKSWMVSVWLTDNGKPKLAKLSEALVEGISQEGNPRRLAILLDGKVVSAPLVKEELSNGRIWIHEDSESEARRIAKGIVSP